MVVLGVKFRGGDEGPVIKTEIDSSEPPWVNSTLKNLIAKRQTTLTRGENPRIQTTEEPGKP